VALFRDYAAPVEFHGTKLAADLMERFSVLAPRAENVGLGIAVYSAAIRSASFSS
jgi:hypothetical protein